MAVDDPTSFTLPEAMGHGLRALRTEAPFAWVAWIALATLSVVSGRAVELLPQTPDALADLGVTLAATWIGMAASMVAAVGLTHHTLKVARGQPVELLATLLRPTNVAAYIAVSLAFTTAALVGLVLIVPFIPLMLVYPCCVWLAADRGAGVVEAFAGAARISRGFRGTLAGLMVLTTAPALAMALFAPVTPVWMALDIGVSTMAFALGAHVLAYVYVRRLPVLAPSAQGHPGSGQH